jgi:seryl-tRNA synthetase
MQDIKQIRARLDEFREVVKLKKMNIDVDELLTLDDKRNELNSKIENLRRQRNNNVDEIKKIPGKPPEDLIEKGKKIKEELSVLESEFVEIDKKYFAIMWKTPQFISKQTPIGKDDSENVERRRWSPDGGEGANPKKFDYEFKDHIELGLSLNLLDLERGRKTGGFRAYYLKNEGALMHMGLMMYGLKFMQSKGFESFVPPTLVKDEALWGSGHFPFDEENIYVADSLKHIDASINKTNEEDKDKKYLIGTAEPSILNYHRDETLKESELPRKMAGFSQCYRSEIGSYGKDTKGLYRIHEFMKIEQVVFCKNDFEESDRVHQEILGYSEELLQNLGIPYRVLEICTGDMGAGKYRMYDIESWMPSRDSYGETHSASNLGDWQSRRLNIKAVDKDGNKYYPHALNNTVVASPRILIAIWENYQNPDGTITVPEVLREYVGKDVIGR